MKRNTWIALSVLVATAIAYFAVKQGPKTEVDSPLEFKKVEKLERIEWRRANVETKKITFEKKQDTWRLAKPVQAAAAKRIAEKLGSEFDQTIQTDLHRIRDGKLKEYHLDKGNRVEVKLYSEGSDEATHRFFAGKQKSISGTGAVRTYIKQPGDKNIYRAQASFGDLVRKKLKELRSNEITDISGENLVRITVENSRGETVSLANKAQVKNQDQKGTSKANWQFESADVKYKPANEQVEAFVDRVSPLRASGFIDNRKLSEVGLSSPKVALSFENKSGATNKIHLSWFTDKDDEKVFVAKVPGKPHIFKVEASTARRLDASTTTFRTRIPFALNSEIESLRFHGKQPIVVERSSDKWALKTPSKDMELNQSKVDSLANTLIKLEIESYQSGQNPQLKKAVTMMTKKGEYDLWLGGNVADANPEQRFARYGKSPLVGLPTHRAEQFELSLEDLEKSSKKKPQVGGMGGGRKGMKNMPPGIKKKLRRKLKQKAAGN